METENKINEKPNSCKISINAKGQMSGELKIYEDTVEKAIDIAKKKAKELKTFMEVENTK